MVIWGSMYPDALHLQNGIVKYSLGLYSPKRYVPGRDVRPGRLSALAQKVLTAS